MYGQSGIVVFAVIFTVSISMCCCKKLDDINIDDENDIRNKLFQPPESCKFQCASGVRPSTNPDYVPVKKGCDSFTKALDFGNDVPEWTECCNKHHQCYGTCNADLATCDKNYHQCLVTSCDNYPSKMDVCTQSSQTLFRIAQAIGCASYKIQQKRACLCDGKDEL